MSQRGGAVHAHVRYANSPIYSDTIPIGFTDIILTVEPLEGLRYVDYLSERGTIITSINPYKNIENYPHESFVIQEIKKIKNRVFVDAEKIAKESCNAKATNMVMLGASMKYLDFDQALIEECIKEYFSDKGKGIVDSNIEVFRKGIHSNIGFHSN